MTSRYSLNELDPESIDDWDAFVDASPEGTLFHRKGFLDSFPQQHRFFHVCKGSEVKAGFVVSTHPHDSRRIVPVYGVIHNGPFFVPDLDPSRKRAKNQSTRFDILDSLVEKIPEFFDEVFLSLSPGITDIRPFLWFNYHAGCEAARYRVDVRYTSYLDIRGIEEEDDLSSNRHFSELSYSRRQEIRYAFRDGIDVERTEDLSEFFDVYREFAAKYDDEVEVNREYLEKACSELASRNRLRLYRAVNSDGRCGAWAAFGLESGRACYLYGITDPEDRQSSAGSVLLWQAFRDLSREGILEVDMEGVNSPQRGWFKLSFGGDLRPYYCLVLRQEGQR